MTSRIIIYICYISCYYPFYTFLLTENFAIMRNVSYNFRIINIYEEGNTMYCSRCGTQVPNTARFCSNCAAQIRPVQPAPNQMQSLSPSWQDDQNIRWQAAKKVQNYKNRCIAGMITSVIAFISLIMGFLFSFSSSENIMVFFMIIGMLSMFINGIILFWRTPIIYLFPINIIIIFICNYVGSLFVFVYFLVKYVKFKREFP